jgi:DNA (cytosine-5)-methyltransferase 1
MLKPWRTAAEIIDWSIPCPSIFDRKKPLAENTLKRIARGLKKFVIEESEPFIVPIGYGERKGQEPRVHDINSPLNTIVSTCKQYLVTPYVTKFQQNSNGQVLKKPIDTVMAGATRFGLVAPILTQYHSYDTDTARGQEVTEPIRTIDTSNRYALTCAFLSKYFGGGYNGPGANVSNPLPTVTGIDHNAVVTSHLIAMYGTSTGSSVKQPLPTITAIGQHIGEVRAFLIKYYGGDGNVGQSINKPLDTITSHDRFGLVMVHGEPYQIVDIGMRMLTPRELFNAQGFPEDYIIDHDYTGKEYPKSAQVARCGNAVCPPVAKALVEANLPELCEKSISSKLTI